jgi:ornithine cyclodeaminase/alanine dehydrogenase-like protein (mu-crystallin family)
MVRYINERQVCDLLPIADAIPCIEQAFRDRARGLAFDTPRQRTTTPHGHLHILQAASTTLRLIGFKAYFPGRDARTFLVHLIDLEHGHLRGIIEADEMGIRRTAAATGVAVRALSREDSSILACFGSGRHGLAQLEAVLAVRQIRSVRIVGRTPAHLELFRQNVAERFGLAVEIVASAREALDGADIVNIVTRADTPLFDGALLQKGQHINAVGSNALMRRELDIAAIKACDVIVVDSVEVAQREAGDLLPAIENGLVHWRNLPDLGSVLIGEVAGRSGPDQITLFESQGMGVQDLYAGDHVLKKALLQNIGTELPPGTFGRPLLK